MRRLLLIPFLSVFLVSCAPTPYASMVQYGIDWLQKTDGFVNTYDLQGDEAQIYLPGLENYIASNKHIISVTFEPGIAEKTGLLGQSVCYSNPEETDYGCEITIEWGHGINTAVYTLFHELAHVAHGPFRGLSMNEAEIIAETVALVVQEKMPISGAQRAGLTYLNKYTAQERDAVLCKYQTEIKTWSDAIIAYGLGLEKKGSH